MSRRKELRKYLIFSSRGRFLAKKPKVAIVIGLVRARGGRPSWNPAALARLKHGRPPGALPEGPTHASRPRSRPTYRPPRSTGVRTRGLRAADSLGPPLSARATPTGPRRPIGGRVAATGSARRPRPQPRCGPRLPGRPVAPLSVARARGGRSPPSDPSRRGRSPRAAQLSADTVSQPRGVQHGLRGR